MFKYNNHTLKKLENLFEKLGYIVRFEKGHFQSGYCLLEERKVVVINRYYDMEAKINVMVDILSKVDADLSLLDEKERKFYNEAAAAQKATN